MCVYIFHICILTEHEASGSVESGGAVNGDRSGHQIGTSERAHPSHHHTDTGHHTPGIMHRKFLHRYNNINTI